MPKSENQKQKILFVMDYLQKHSHKDNPISATELIRMLKQEGISADRKSIYSDVQALIEFGLDIRIDTFTVRTDPFLFQHANQFCCTDRIILM